MSTSTRNGSFKSMGLCEEVTRSIDKLGFKHPTPIQRRAIPAILTGVDCVAMARTGSGKTAAFAIPTIHRLGKHSEIMGARAIVLSPTRELAMQTCKVFQLLARFTDLRVALIVGGHSMDGQFDRLMNNPDIIVATPGRLIHHLQQEGAFGLDRVESLVLDEADRLFELGFSDQISSILKSCPSSRQALLFSATLPSLLVRFAKAGLQSPEFIRLDSECSLSDNLDLYMSFTRAEAKPAALISCIRALRAVQGEASSLKKTIVFVATRHHVDFLGQLVEKANVASVACIYGSMDQVTRTASLAAFRSGKASVMIVTDVAARGIDIPDVDNVIHYDFPCSPKLFIHRSGRTARAGRSGLCLSMVTAGEMPYLMDLLLFIDARLVLSGNKDDAEAKMKKNNIEPQDGMIVEVMEEGQTTCEREVPAIEIGAIPFVDEDVEMVDRMIQADSELESGKRSMELSLGPYFKTRPSASKQAVRRAHLFTEECGGQQVLLSRCLSLLENLQATSVGVGSSVSATQREEILKSLRSFRPSHSSHQHSAGSSSGIVKTDTRRALLDRVEGAKLVRQLASQFLKQDQGSDIEKEDEDGEEYCEMVEKVEKKANRRDFRSKEFFHTVNVPSQESAARDRGFELEQHRMDLVPETEQEMNKAARYGKKWDSKKMNYVTVRIGSDGKAIKNEAGKRMTKKDLEKGKGLYKEWTKKTKKRIQKIGEVEAAGLGPKKGGPRVREQEISRNEENKCKFVPGKKNGTAVNSKEYHGEVPWQYLTNKQKRLEGRKSKGGAVTSRGNEKRAETLKTPQAIAKARKLKSDRQTLQNPKKRKEFHKQSKDQYMQKQQKKIKANSAPARSWAKNRSR